MQRAFAAILLIAVLVIGGGLIATTAYQAGLSQVVTTTTDGARVVVPVAGYGWGYGYGHPFGFGFGFFGFLGTLIFLFLVFGLIRAVFFRGGPGRRGWGPGWGPRGGGWGPGDHDHPRGQSFWEGRFGESFDEWHRRAHDGQTAAESSGQPPAPNTPSKPA
jgi:hypothetical protein